MCWWCNVTFKEVRLVDTYENPAGLIISGGSDSRAQVYNKDGQLVSHYDLNEWDVMLTLTRKPSFKPGYYEANTTTHDVRWFTSPPENPAWKRVKVTPDD